MKIFISRYNNNVKKEGKLCELQYRITCFVFLIVWDSTSTCIGGNLRHSFRMLDIEFMCYLTNISALHFYSCWSLLLNCWILKFLWSFLLTLSISTVLHTSTNLLLISIDNLQLRNTDEYSYRWQFKEVFRTRCMFCHFLMQFGKV